MKDIKVVAYLTPHPLDEDSFLEEEWISWLPGYVQGDTDEGLPSYYHESNIDLFEKIEGLTVKVFTNALLRMWPLLEDHYIQSINIGIDYSIDSGSSTTLAGYHYKNSKPSKGKYYFSVDRNLLIRYATFVNQNINRLPNLGIWEHELIHLIDQWELVKASAFAHSDVPANNLYYYLLKYREEGIANLFDLMDGRIDELKSIKEAYALFQSQYLKIKEKLIEVQTTNSNIRNEIYSGYEFYSAGPWIILDMLREIPMVTDICDIDVLENKIINNELIEDWQKLEIIKHAFHVDTEWFYSRIKSKIDL